MAASQGHTPSANALQLPPVFRIVVLAIFAAVGIVLRQVALPTSLPYVTFTPGFTMPLLTGVALGPIDGLACGLIVGISGGLTEPVLLPVLGNIALGLSTGVPSLARRRLPYLLWGSLCVVSGSFFGGFLPTYSIEVLVFLVQPIPALTAALADGLQGTLWAIVAVILDRTAVQPLLQGLTSNAGAESGRAAAKP